MKIIGLLIFIFLAMYAAFEIILNNSSTGNPGKSPLIIAHRGGAKIGPENTKVTILNAMVKNVQGIEFDIRMTKDNVLILMHDKKVNRTTDGSGEVHQLTGTEIQALDAGSYYSENHLSEKVPTLHEILKLPKPDSLFYIIEVKDPKLYPGLELRLSEAVQEYDASRSALIMSFDFDFAKNYKIKNPTQRVGVFRTSVLGVKTFDGLEVIGLHWSNIMLFPGKIKKLKEKGVHIFAWTVNNPKIINYLIKQNIDGIITDNPLLFTEANRRGHD